MSAALWNRRSALLGGAGLIGASAFSGRAFADDERPALWISGHEVQGGLVLCRAPAGSQAWVENRPVRISDGLFCFGFGRDADKPVAVMVEYPNGKRETKSVDPAARKFDIQRINGLPDKYVSPPQDVLDRIKRDSKAVGESRTHDTDLDAFAESFDWPAKGPISSVYGSQRILNGEPREPHYGVDIASPAGTPIHAPTDGIVRLAEELYLSGNTIVFDHGHGVTTSYLHMSRMDVKVGDKLSRGDVMGAIGMTGRATGPHLCWRLNWFQTRLDVALVAAARPAADKT